MSNKIMKFFSEEFGDVRGIYFGGQAWFYATDICRALDIKNARDAVGRLKEDEKTSIVAGRRRAKNGVSNSVGSTDGNSGAYCGWVENRVNVINEPGVYRLIFTSRKPSAERFQHWVFHEVLPEMRRKALWEEARAEGKRVHRELTDAIKSFIEYLEARGELDRAEVAWYSAFSNLVNKVTDTKDKRDDLPMLSVLRLSDCENILIHGIEEGMAAGKGHHDIWVACNEKLDTWRQLTK